VAYTVEKLCIASTNAGKVREISSFLAPHFELCFLGDFDSPIREADEPFKTFSKNAQFKAKYYAQFTKMPTLSDDAGLQIRSLNNFPGIRSRRFIEESGGRQGAFDRLEQMLLAKEDRRAQFVCVSAIYDPQSGRSFTGKGVMRGELRFPAKGSYGFGFEPIFVPETYTQSVAELGETVKMLVGHRGKSLRILLDNYRRGLSL
jgi:XTP/dITP diphosphohydrolase